MTVTASPAIRAPALPLPSAHGHPGAATRRREMHAPLSRQRQAATRPPDWAPAAKHGQIRASSVHAHRSLAGIPVRYVSVDTATPRPTATQDDTRQDRAETARIAEDSQLAGRLRRWWQVLGSNQPRLSGADGFTARRSYPRPMPLTSAYAVRGGIPGQARPLYVRAYRAWSTDGAGKIHGRVRWERSR
jgi:hypothetical protein